MEKQIDANLIHSQSLFENKYSIVNTSSQKDASILSITKDPVIERNHHSSQPVLSSGMIDTSSMTLNNSSFIGSDHSANDYRKYKNQLNILQNMKGNGSFQRKHFRCRFQEVDEEEEATQYLERMIPEKIVGHYSKFQKYRENEKNKWNAFVEHIAPPIEMKKIKKKQKSVLKGVTESVDDQKENKENESPNVQKQRENKNNVPTKKVDKKLPMIKTVNLRDQQEEEVDHTNSNEDRDQKQKIKSVESYASRILQIPSSIEFPDEDKYDFSGSQKVSKCDTLMARYEYIYQYKDALQPHFAGLNQKTADLLVRCKKEAISKWNQVEGFFEQDKQEGMKKKCEYNLRLMNDKLHQFKCSPLTQNIYNKKSVTIADMKRFKSESALPTELVTNHNNLSKSTHSKDKQVLPNIPLIITSSDEKTSTISTVFENKDSNSQTTARAKSKEHSLLQSPPSILRVSRSTGFIETTSSPAQHFQTLFDKEF
ncbi:hypothetical protein C9374_004473 [Naegleria lovaniensis]|uniref:Uncharacterized protein n=1 Tax=Naegleria lovaniensis TaxID=51637 RepID=A0AA88KNZ6_NAELO|nr:uncharacterized protein C9374_004473 [Naegleria lovaniensis]KAG2383136.1 hypothetical protein C9374_004473 [Naegleria lovaniensis]